MGHNMDAIQQHSREVQTDAAVFVAADSEAFCTPADWRQLADLAEAEYRRAEAELWHSELGQRVKSLHARWTRLRLKANDQSNRVLERRT